jgi:hypothetical protein
LATQSRRVGRTYLFLCHFPNEEDFARTKDSPIDHFRLTDAILWDSWDSLIPIENGMVLASSEYSPYVEPVKVESLEKAQEMMPFSFKEKLAFFNTQGPVSLYEEQPFIDAFVALKKAREGD